MGDLLCFGKVASSQIFEYDHEIVFHKGLPVLLYYNHSLILVLFCDPATGRGPSC